MIRNKLQVQAALSRIHRVDELLVHQNQLRSQLVQLKTLLSSHPKAPVTGELLQPPLCHKTQLWWMDPRHTLLHFRRTLSVTN